jgi:hypothetical protein
VAGGKGYLNLALREQGFQKVVTFDKRHKVVQKIDYRYAWFDDKVEEEFDLLVGLHSDEATDHIIVEAGRRRIPFVIVPCCVKPSAIPYRASHGRVEWLTHLTREAQARKFEVTICRLRMNGRNEVLVGKPIK